MPGVSHEKEALIDAALVRERLHYDPETGAFIWKVKPAGPVKAGSPAGTINSKGYRVILINWKTYVAHRLAWLYVYGEWPSVQVDHINGDKADNRLANLRLATNSQNQANRGPQKRNKSGVKGVFWNRARRRWVASIRVDGKLKHIGEYRDLTEAADAYARTARAEFGEFARTA